MRDYSMQAIVALLRRYALERHRYVALLARSLDLGRTEYDALDYIQELGEMTPTELASRLCLTRAAVTALADRLEAAGLVQRHPDASDRRRLLLRLTAAAELKGAAELVQFLSDQEAAAGELSAAGRAAVGRFLEAAAMSAETRARTFRGSAPGEGGSGPNARRVGRPRTS